MSVLKMTDLDLAGKQVLIREDLNVPLAGGQVTSDQRIRAALPTLEAALSAGAAVLVMSHLGRPAEGHFQRKYSLAPVAAVLGQRLGIEVRFASDWLAGVEVAPGQLVLCENVRFNAGETNDDETLARRMAALCDIYVMDAFGTAHRAHASTHGVARFAPLACAGPLLVRELVALGHALDAPVRPLVAIVGGSKVSTKLTLLKTLAERVDQLIVGGGIANTFIAAAGRPVGKSLYEPDLVEEACRITERAQRRGADIPVPADVWVGTELAASAEATLKNCADVMAGDLILDLGPETAERFALLLRDAGTIVWNGPLGVFEFDQFATGTKALTAAIAESDAFSIAGGGDTLAAIDRFGVADRISYISTGGGAFLEFLEGRRLPAVAILEARAAAGGGN